MYSTEFLPYIVRHYRRCRKVFKYYPFRFNPELNRFVKDSNPYGERMFKLLLLVMLAYSGTTSCCLIFGSLSMAKKVQGVVFSLMYVLITVCTWNYDLDKSQIQVINSCLNFEDNIMEGMKQSSTLLKD